HPHAKHGEIIITRRLYRSGESEYLINGRSARLRDIQDLFTGTGLGPESYAIIEQGRIGQILSNKPADRRAIIEEAAGIGKYKTRKRLAESKLESARQNLSRVFDILEEVTRQLNSLKRQASKAKRYEELKGEMDAKLRIVLAGRFRTLERDAAKAAADLDAASAELRMFSDSVAAHEQESCQYRQNVAELESLTVSARQRSLEKNEAREVLQGRLREREKSLETGRLAVLRLLGEASTLKNQLAQVDEYLAGIERER